MSEMNLSQQDNIFDSLYAQPITVIGAGSVGSNLVMMLARMGIKDMTVYDGDAIESHNIPMSVYRPSDLGRFKVRALESIVKENTGLAIKGILKMYEGKEILRGTVVACVDTMEARQLIFNQVRQNPLVDLFVDTRVGTELISVFTIEPCSYDDLAYYGPFLAYSTKETAMPFCGSHGINFIACRTASAVCANLTSFWQNATKKRHHQELAIQLLNIK